MEKLECQECSRVCMSERWDFMCVGVMRGAPEKDPTTVQPLTSACLVGKDLINIMRAQHNRSHDFQHVFEICKICNIVNIHYST